MCSEAQGEREVRVAKGCCICQGVDKLQSCKSADGVEARILGQCGLSGFRVLRLQRLGLRNSIIQRGVAVEVIDHVAQILVTQLPQLLLSLLIQLPPRSERHNHVKSSSARNFTLSKLAGELREQV